MFLHDIVFTSCCGIQLFLKGGQDLQFSKDPFHSCSPVGASSVAGPLATARHHQGPHRAARGRLRTAATCGAGRLGEKTGERERGRNWQN